MDDKNKLFLMKLIGGAFIAGIIVFLALIFFVEISSVNFTGVIIKIRRLD